jgi:hypothetical protein
MVGHIESLGEKVVSDEWMDFVREILSAGGSHQNIAIGSQTVSQRVLCRQTTKYVPGTDKENSTHYLTLFCRQKSDNQKVIELILLSKLAVALCLF